MEEWFWACTEFMFWENGNHDNIPASYPGASQFGTGEHQAPLRARNRSIYIYLDSFSIFLN